MQSHLHFRVALLPGHTLAKVHPHRRVPFVCHVGGQVAVARVVERGGFTVEDRPLAVLAVVVACVLTAMVWADTDKQKKKLKGEK